MEKEQKEKNPLIKGLENLHKKMCKSLDTDNGECFFGVMNQGESLTRAYYGDLNVICRTLITVIANDEELSKAAPDNIIDMPHYAEVMLSLALKLDPAKLNLDNEGSKIVAEALRELADKINKQ